MPKGAEYCMRIKDFLPTQSDLDEVQKSAGVGRLLDAFRRMDVWLRFLYGLHRSNESSVLVAAAHSKIIEIQILVPLTLLHSSYMALRTAVDILTSYTFYYTHHIEWRAVCEGRAAWKTRSAIIDWHSEYTAPFRRMQSAFGLVDKLSGDYQQLSSYVHGVPVSGLPTLTGIHRVPVSEKELILFAEMCERVDFNLSLLCLCVFDGNIASLSRGDLKVIGRGVDRSKLGSAGILLPRL